MYELLSMIRAIVIIAANAAACIATWRPQRCCGRRLCRRLRFQHPPPRSLSSRHRPLGCFYALLTPTPSANSAPQPLAPLLERRHPHVLSAR